MTLLMMATIMVAVPFLAVQDLSEVSSEPDELFVYDGLVYEIDYYGTVNVVGPEDSWDQAELVVPSRVSHDGTTYIVSEISPHAFENIEVLESVVLPDTVVDMGSSAFAGCTSLVNINIPGRVTQLIETFAGCTSLESVILTGISYETELRGTFEGCSNLKDVAIRWTAVVGDNTFAGCSSLTGIDIGHIRSIGNQAFAGCTSLEELDFRDMITHIGDYAFAGCTSLTSVNILGTEDVTVGVGAFSDCVNLESVYISENVTSIGEDAFRGCNSLSILTVLSSQCKVGVDAFDGCLAVETVHIHDLDVLGELPIGDSLLSLTLGGEIDRISSEIVPPLKNLSTLVLEEGVAVIGDGAFEHSGSLELIAIPDSLETIGESAFDVDRTCMVAGSESSVDLAGVADPRYGFLITYEVSGRPDVADHRIYGWVAEGEELVLEPEDVEGCTVKISIDGEDIQDVSVLPNDDVTVRFMYDDGGRVVMFYDWNVLIAYYRVHLGDQIPIPDNPSHSSTGDFRYEFRGWDGLTPGDVVTGNESFSSDFVLVPEGTSDAQAVDGMLTFDYQSEIPIYLTKEVATDILARNAVEGLQGASFTFVGFSKIWISLGNDDLSKITDEGLTFGMRWYPLEYYNYNVILEGSDGSVSLDVDSRWMSANQITEVRIPGSDGTPLEVESNSVWHDGNRYVRFSTTESISYNLVNIDPGTSIGIWMVLAIIIVIAAIGMVAYHRIGSK